MRLFARIILDTRPSGYAALTKNRSGRFFPNRAEARRKYAVRE